MAKNRENPARVSRRANRTESKVACLARHSLRSSEPVGTAPNRPGLAWKLSPAGTWSYVVLSAS